MDMGATSVADDREVDGIEPTVEFDDDRDAAVLARPSVQAKVGGATWTGVAEVLLERCPRPAVRILCLFDNGVEQGEALRLESAPGTITEVIVHGRAVAGFGTKATFFPDQDGAKALVEWQPGNLPVEGVGAPVTRMDRVRFSLFNFDLPGLPHHNGSRIVERIELCDEQWTVRMQGLMRSEEVWTRINKDGGST